MTSEDVQERVRFGLTSVAQDSNLLAKYMVDYSQNIEAKKFASRDFYRFVTGARRDLTKRFNIYWNRPGREESEEQEQKQKPQEAGQVTPEEPLILTPIYSEKENWDEIQDHMRDYLRRVV